MQQGLRNQCQTCSDVAIARYATATHQICLHCFNEYDGDARCLSCLRMCTQTMCICHDDVIGHEYDHMEREDMNEEYIDEDEDFDTDEDLDHVD